MLPVHRAPHEAINAHAILAAGISVAIPHGTFQLADDRVDTAKGEFVSRQLLPFLVLDNSPFADIS
jgi:hypothetical protein